MNYMRHTTKFLIVLILLTLMLTPAYSALQGGVDYQIPIDYTKLNQSELEAKAEFYYNSAINSKKLDEDITSALVLYTILTNKDPQNYKYSIRLGKLYDVISKDKLAKGNYYRAMGLDQKRPEPYFYLGEYYYDREKYKKALKFYQRAYDTGYSTHYYTLYRMGDIYQKFGDTKNSLKYLQSAYGIEANNDLREKIRQVEDLEITGKEYYRK